jgi:CO/xanthine dehydrogenase Mo-binding subunit
MMGNAAIQAAERARDVVARAAAEKLEVPATRLAFADNKVFDTEDPERKWMSFAQAVVCAEAKFGTIATAGSYTPPQSPGRYRGAGVGPTPTYSYSACVADLSADEETGGIRCHKIWIAHDIGQAINGNLAIGQVEGGVYMGLGEALMEEMAYRPRRQGVHKIPSMLEYKSPTTMEMPEVETILVEDPDDRGPFGAKEVGQGPLLPVMPAVANAVHDALRIRVDQVPITPELVLEALSRDDRRAGPKGYPDLRAGKPVRIRTPEEGGDGYEVDQQRKEKQKRREERAKA